MSRQACQALKAMGLYRFSPPALTLTSSFSNSL